MDTQPKVAEQLAITVTPPAMPMILANAGFMTTLANVEAQIATMKVTDAQSAQAAGDLQTRLTKAEKSLNEARLGLTRPIQSIIDTINSTAKGPLARIDAAKAAVKTLLIDYSMEVERQARKAEKERQAEIARLEKIRKAEADAAAAKQTAPMEDFDFDDAPPPTPVKTETERQIEAVTLAPPAVAISIIFCSSCEASMRL